jgi:hypothetical protein
MSGLAVVLMVSDKVELMMRRDPSLRPQIQAARDFARDAISEYQTWPHIGPVRIVFGNWELIVEFLKPSDRFCLADIWFTPPPFFEYDGNFDAFTDQPTNAEYVLESLGLPTTMPPVAHAVGDGVERILVSDIPTATSCHKTKSSAIDGRAAHPVRHENTAHVLAALGTIPRFWLDRTEAFRRCVNAVIDTFSAKQAAERAIAQIDVTAGSSVDGETAPMRASPPRPSARDAILEMWCAAITAVNDVDAAVLDCERVSHHLRVGEAPQADLDVPGAGMLFYGRGGLSLGRAPRNAAVDFSVKGGSFAKLRRGLMNMAPIAQILAAIGNSRLRAREPLLGIALADLSGIDCDDRLDACFKNHASTTMNAVAPFKMSRAAVGLPVEMGLPSSIGQSYRGLQGGGSTRGYKAEMVREQKNLWAMMKIRSTRRPEIGIHG